MSLLSEHTRIEELIRRKDYSEISLDDLNSMETTLDGAIRYLQDKLEMAEKAIENLQE